MYNTVCDATSFQHTFSVLTERENAYESEKPWSDERVSVSMHSLTYCSFFYLPLLLLFSLFCYFLMKYLPIQNNASSTYETQGYMQFVIVG